MIVVVVDVFQFDLLFYQNPVDKNKITSTTIVDVIDDDNDLTHLRLTPCHLKLHDKQNSLEVA